MDSFPFGADEAWLESLFADPSSPAIQAWSDRLTSQLNQSSVTHTSSETASDSQAALQAKADSLIAAYREIGHLYARTNPLGAYMPPRLRYSWVTQMGVGDALHPESHGIQEKDMDARIHPPRPWARSTLSLRNLINRLKEIYTGSMGVEFLHIRNRPMRRWLIDQLENPTHAKEWETPGKRRWQEDLIRAETFELFIQQKFTGQKRFSLEGNEALIPALEYLFRESAKRNVKQIILGMAHRGRLNVLVNAMNKPAQEIFAMFGGNYAPHAYGGAGDVKYHQGQSAEITTEDGRQVHVTLVANPSHLEAVDPVVQGKTRGTQRLTGDATRKRILPILIHGDAAFSGQGVVAETFNMSQLRGYRTGGTIHIVVNNQIGFTTAGADSRSTFHATDIVKSMPIPVLHANADEPESVMRAIELALRWRQKFGQDVVVDIIGYRRLGHNEADEPSFTHPVMYELIKNHESSATLFGKKLAQENLYSQRDQEAYKQNYKNTLKESKDQAQKLTDFHGFHTLTDEWKGIERDYQFESPETGVNPKALHSVAKALTTAPEGFALHPKLQRFVAARQKATTGEGDVDWAFAESLAFGTLLAEGKSVRLSGEDCGRGTFSQRHALWWDVTTEQPRSHTPLEHVAQNQGKFSVHDSPLSEFSVLGFEYGYSLCSPHDLTIWEAQFGDFANGAQVIIDQFISAGESKWARHSGLVMLLPHGYEGQGPEHSNAYLERYLWLCAEQNLQVVVPSTPLQYFHILRRQVHQNFRKPLVVMTPKGLLRLPEARSSFQDFTKGSFSFVLDDPSPPPTTQRLIFCSGRVWYDLDAARKEAAQGDSKNPAHHTRLVRLEQLYPFPAQAVNEVLSAHPQAQCFWVQEEPRNRGAWPKLFHDLSEHTPVNWTCISRKASASPATGSHEQHVNERKALAQDALGLQGEDS
ncbi:MAG: 2-oxoglutarate dehydrogenase E1 component [Spirochaetales bacterium]|nr:2-oxoglutarate dehydrogenase E1 component [Spirochaetales bacterium]